MSSAAYAFVSYSRRDLEFVERLTGDLRYAGIEVWRDMENIAPGTDWRQQIASSLKGADVLLFVASANSVRSEWIQHELAAFLEHAKPVIPIILDDEGAASLPEPLKLIQWVDCRGVYSDRLVLSLVKALTSIGVSKQPVPVERRERKSKGYVFISYAEEDSDFVTDLKAFLADRDYAFWEYAESERDYHTQLFRELEGIIAEAVATLSVLSEAWKRSRWTVREYFFSDEVGTPVFLLRAKMIGPTLAIAGSPFIDFLDDRARGFNRLEKELRKKGL